MPIRTPKGPGTKDAADDRGARREGSDRPERLSPETHPRGSRVNPAAGSILRDRSAGRRPVRGSRRRSRVRPPRPPPPRSGSRGRGWSASGSVRINTSTGVQRPTVASTSSRRPSVRYLPGDRRILVLGDPRPARPLGAGGDQVREAQPHLRPVADGDLREAEEGVAGDGGPPGAGCRGPRRSILGIAMVLGGTVERDAGGLREVLLAIQRQDIDQPGVPSRSSTFRRPSNGS